MDELKRRREQLEKHLSNLNLRRLRSCSIYARSGSNFPVRSAPRRKLEKKAAIAVMSRISWK
jgi:hypothetical protein